jgi:hypothetical protein
MVHDQPASGPKLEMSSANSPGKFEHWLAKKPYLVQSPEKLASVQMKTCPSTSGSRVWERGENEYE